MVDEFYKRAAKELSGRAFLVLVYIWHQSDKDPTGGVMPVTVCGLAYRLDYFFGDITLIMKELESKGWVKLIALDKFGRNHRWSVVELSDVPRP